MDTKHTPGEWWIDDDGFVAAGHGDDYMTVADPLLGVTTPRYGSVAEREANASLIAAAPDLLEALRKVSAALEAVYQSEMEWTGEWDMLPPDALEMAKAAIRKAEGE